MHMSVWFARFWFATKKRYLIKVIAPCIIFLAVWAIDPFEASTTGRYSSYDTFNELGASLYDRRNLSSSIIVLIDDSSLPKERPVWPIATLNLVQLLDEIRRGEPAAIFADIAFVTSRCPPGEDANFCVAHTGNPCRLDPANPLHALHGRFIGYPWDLPDGASRPDLLGLSSEDGLAAFAAQASRSEFGGRRTPLVLAALDPSEGALLGPFFQRLQKIQAHTAKTAVASDVLGYARANGSQAWAAPDQEAVRDFISDLELSQTWQALERAEAAKGAATTILPCLDGVGTPAVIEFEPKGKSSIYPLAFETGGRARPPDEFEPVPDAVAEPPADNIGSQWRAAAAGGASLGRLGSAEPSSDRQEARSPHIDPSPALALLTYYCATRRAQLGVSAPEPILIENGLPPACLAIDQIAAGATAMDGHTHELVLQWARSFRLEALRRKSNGVETEDPFFVCAAPATEPLGEGRHATRSLDSVRNAITEIFRGVLPQGFDLRPDCPPILTIRADVGNRGMGWSKRLQEQVKDKVVFIGTDLSSAPDRLPVPVYENLPGVYWHAMAFDNLLTLGPDYRRPGGWLTVSIHAACMLLLGVLAVPLWHRQEQIIARLDRSRMRLGSLAGEPARRLQRRQAKLVQGVFIVESRFLRLGLVLLFVLLAAFFLTTKGRYPIAEWIGGIGFALLLYFRGVITALATFVRRFFVGNGLLSSILRTLSTSAAAWVLVMPETVPSLDETFAWFMSLAYVAFMVGSWIFDPVARLRWAQVSRHLRLSWDVLKGTR